MCTICHQNIFHTCKFQDTTTKMIKIKPSEFCAIFPRKTPMAVLIIGSKSFISVGLMDKSDLQTVQGVTSETDTTSQSPPRHTATQPPL